MSNRFYLESAPGPGHPGRRFDLDRFPAILGRHSAAEVQIVADRVSREHAEIRRCDAGRLWLRDLDSTNGTWLNGARLSGETDIRPGDVIHIGDVELRLGVVEAATTQATPDNATRIGMQRMPHAFPVQAREFDELVKQSRVQAWCQPIVRADGTPFGFELLGRGDHPALDQSPGELFALAAALERAVELSELLRRCCFAAADHAALPGVLFFNTHAEETREPERLLRELADLRGRHPALKLVFEVHETAVTDLARMAEIRSELSRLDIALAYDDFGAGQARLRELIEVPPDYLKFDMALVRGITEPGSARRTLLETLNGWIRGFDVCTLAEGVEDAETASVCAEIGIDLIQGFHFGRPRPVSSPR